MTCQGCVNTVIKNLKKVQDISNVDVDFEQEKVKISISRDINILELQKFLSDKYTLNEIIHKNESSLENDSANHSTNQNTKIKQLIPLGIIFLYITIGSNLMHLNDWTLEAFMLDFMGLFFIVFSFFKMLDLKGFPGSFRMYDPVAKRVPLYGWIYPFIETALGLMFLIRFEVKIALIVTIIILGITTFGVTKTLLDKKSIKCACLGTVLNLPMTEATFIENFIMITMAVYMLSRFMY
jgi:copper chaperone CopZ|tara:strand:+ start:374 stop:1087 length:714 start_codon:yes stop_codon:yes gene_type:complete